LKIKDFFFRTMADTNTNTNIPKSITSKVKKIGEPGWGPGSPSVGADVWLSKVQSVDRCDWNAVSAVEGRTESSLGRLVNRSIG
jgi:hypothetical protein